MVDAHEVAPGIFRAHYRTAADLVPEQQSSLVEAVRAAAAKGPTAIIFVLEAGIRLVDVSVPTYWLNVTGQADLKLKAMAIVSTSIAVTTAAKGFAIANVVRRVDLDVRTFAAEAGALDWAKSVLAR